MILNIFYQTDKPFPDITKSVADSYIMGVEYTIPGAVSNICINSF